MDEKGFKIGVPIKASSLSTKPTLKNLKKEFEKNGLLRESHKQSLKEKIDSALTKQHGTMQDLIKLLKKEQINVLLRQNAEGRIYGITFIDNKTCCVFNGSDLGKGYSAAALQKSILNPAINIPENSEPRAKSKLQTVASGITKQEGKELTLEKPQAKQSIPELLMSPQPNFSNTPSQLKKKKKKQRRLGFQIFKLKWYVRWYR